MVKKIISNTILFACILLFISGFRAIFSAANSLVGVAIIVALLVLMKSNLTIHPIQNFFTLLIIYVLLGILSHIGSSHIILGAIINLVVLTAIGYSLTYSLSKTLIIPIGLLYLFMFFEPVSGHEYTLRLLALVVGPIIIMSSQFLIHGLNKKISTPSSLIIDFAPDSTNDYKEVSLLGRSFLIHPLRASYSLRIGILGGVTTLLQGFILQYYGITEGKWLVYTIFSLTELYSQNCRIKSKQRIEGTLIGAVIILILFFFIKDPTLRGIIMLLAGYANSFVSNYRDSMIIVTITAIASDTLAAGTTTIILLRIAFVSIGILLALLGNKYLFPERNNE